VYSGGRYLDLLPAGGGKGTAVRYLAARLGLPLEAVLTCGDSGNDREMLTMGCHAATVSNHGPELADLGGALYRARLPYAGGVHEAMQHFGLV
jgi:hydroxymethylpyrimidine pyrophosphatase-like HAD family hydrolase